MASRSRFPFRAVAIAAAFANLGIHLSLVPDHLAEKLYIGILFVIGSALLGIVMVGLATDRDTTRTAAWGAGSLVSAAMFAGFVVSRTAGLPLGYHEDWVGTTEDLLGLSALFLELVFIGCALALAGRAAPGTSRWRPVHDRTAPLK